jgi:hypothetical protein
MVSDGHLGLPYSNCGPTARWLFALLLVPTFLLNRPPRTTAAHTHQPVPNPPRCSDRPPKKPSHGLRNGRTGMKKSRYMEEQIIEILKPYEAGVKTADLCREDRISESQAST